MATTFNSAKLAQMCVGIDCVNTYMASVMAKFLRKMAVIKRLAALLEISGDLITLPDVSKFIPVIDIDLNLYLRLRVDCPGLNLPAVGSVDDLAGLDKLRGTVLNAYAGIDKMLNDHPWNRAGWLQNKANALYSELVAPVVEVADNISGMLACFKAICDDASKLGTVSESVMVSMNENLAKVAEAPGELTSAMSDSMAEKFKTLQAKRAALRAYAPQLDPLDYSDKGLGLDVTTP